MDGLDYLRFSSLIESFFRMKFSSEQNNAIVRSQPVQAYKLSEQIIKIFL